MGKKESFGLVAFEGGTVQPKVSKKKKAPKKTDNGWVNKFLNILDPNRNLDQSNDDNVTNYKDLSEAEKKERIAYLWSKARRYNSKLRF